MPDATISLLRLRSKVFRLAFACLATVAVSLCLAPAAAAQDAAANPPSILLIVTDDQRWDTLWAMPEVQRSLVEPGVSFEESFTTSSLCCPSRASILTGAYPHTTGVYRQGGRFGGFWSFDDRTTIATALADAGYRTGFFGKYLDAYQRDALKGYVPPGWDRWVAFVHAEYFDYGLTVDGDVHRHGLEPDDYSTDVLASHTEDFIRGTEGPLFALFAPAAPHAPALPAPADETGFDDLPTWTPPSFDEADRTDKPEHIRALDPLDPGRTETLERLRRNQYRSLQAVDRAVERLLDALGDTGRLDDAVVIFTSDNGLLWGEHRWLKKEVPYEEAIRVPLVVRADAIVGEGARTDRHLVANIDLAPTIAAAAGVELPGADGMSLLPLVEGRAETWRDALLIEHMRGTNPIPTYCAVRTARYLFASYETGERELYDLEADPFQLQNLTGTEPSLEGRLDTTLRGLCEPPPPGLRPQIGMLATLLGVAAVAGLAVTARWLVARSAERRRVA
ncbi:MAG: sulfatase [Actinobacteria bacterium]|nr:sulfatase [Actinomycetota bacterium]